MKKMSLSLMAIAVIVFVFSSCEKDLYEDSLQNSARNITIKHISMSDLDKTTSLRINEKIALVKKMNKKDSTMENRFEYDSSLGMYIDTENGRLIDNNGEVSYTFPMFRDSEEHLENIIFKPISTGEIETYVSKYNVKPEEFVDLTYQEIAALEPELQKMSASGWYVVCIESQTQTGVTPIDNGDLTGNFGYEPVWETTGTTCYFIDNSGSSPMDFPVITSNGTAGNSGGGTGTTGVSTSPILSPEQLLMKNFIRNLTEDQEDWYVENPDAHESIQDYLEENVFSEQSKELVRDMINLSISTTSSFVFNNTIIPPSTNVFNNVLEFQNFLNNNEGVSQELVEITPANLANDYIGTYKFGIGTLGGIAVNVKFTGTIGEPLSVSNVTTQQYGTMFSTWTQDSYTANVNTTSNTTRIDIYGSLGYDISIGGVGIISKHNYHLILIVDNTSTGVIFSSWVKY